MIPFSPPDICGLEIKEVADAQGRKSFEAVVLLNLLGL